MKLLLRFPHLLALAAAVMAAAPSAAQVEPRVGSSFAVVARPVALDREQVARANSAMVEFDVRPILAVTLAQPIPHALAGQFGAKREVPFDAGLRLYGWPERPGLYCDLLRSRGLYMSSACLRDSDADGDFDEGLRLDFHSAHADLLGVTPNGKIIGMNFTKVRVPLSAPIAYAPAAPAAEVTGKLALYWKRTPDKASGRELVELWISTPSNSTGTEGLSQNVVMFDRTKIPLDVELYGIRLRVHGFDANGRLRYTLLGMTGGVPIPLLFRGYTFHILII
ncbi:MAG TPA: hypothetical protein VGF69_08905 [Thermoanaerobaculia bacterium]|jgi:hypothetical protein